MQGTSGPQRQSSSQPTSTKMRSFSLLLLSNAIPVHLSLLVSEARPFQCLAWQKGIRPGITLCVFLEIRQGLEPTRLPVIGPDYAVNGTCRTASDLVRVRISVVQTI